MSETSKPRSLFNFVSGVQALPVGKHVTPDEVLSIAASIAEFKARCARNGLCHNDGKPCKYYRNCVLERCAACLTYATKKKTTHSTLACSNCKYYPGDGKTCADFICMTAYRGR